MVLKFKTTINKDEKSVVSLRQIILFTAWTLIMFLNQSIVKNKKYQVEGLINIQNLDSITYLKWCLFRYLHHVGKNGASIRKIDKNFARKLDFKDIKFPVKIRDIHNSEK